MGQPGALTHWYRGGDRKAEFAVCDQSETWTGVPTAEQVHVCGVYCSDPHVTF